MEYSEFELAFFKEGEDLSDTNEVNHNESGARTRSWLMRTLRRLGAAMFLAVLAISACQSAVPAEKPQTGYQKDVDRICSGVEKSGAMELEEGARAMHVGIWLARNLETQEGRDLSAQLSQLPTPERISKLETISRAENIKDCPVLQSWGGG